MTALDLRWRMVSATVETVWRPQSDTFDTDEGIPPSAPAFAAQPSISPSSGTASVTTFTATPGTVSNGTITSRTWRLNGTAISTGLTAQPSAAGTLTYQEFATGPGGYVSSTIRSANVAPDGVGTALSAPTLTLTTPLTHYPPELDFTRPIDWQDGDHVVLQRSIDSTFGTGVTETVGTLAADTTSQSFGLSAIASGVPFFRMAAWDGTRPDVLNWSNTVGMGDATSPTITVATPITIDDGDKIAVSLTADKPCGFVVEGSDAAYFEVTGSVGAQILRLLGDIAADVRTKTSYSITLVATDLFGISATEDVVLNIHSTAIYLDPATMTSYLSMSDDHLSVTGTGGTPVKQVRATGPADLFSIQFSTLDGFGPSDKIGGVSFVDLDATLALGEVVGRTSAHAISFLVGDYGYEVWNKTNLDASDYGRTWSADSNTRLRASRNAGTGDIAFSISFDGGATWMLIHTVPGSGTNLEAYYPCVSVNSSATATATFGA